MFSLVKLTIAFLHCIVAFLIASNCCFNKLISLTNAGVVALPVVCKFVGRFSNDSNLATIASKNDLSISPPPTPIPDP